jgi:UPF0755 protein
MNYSVKQPRYSLRTKLLVVAVSVGLVLAIIGYLGFRFVYTENLLPPGGSSASQIVEIEPGSTTQQVAKQLEADGLIKASWAFAWYMRTAGLRSELQAGTYALNSDQSVQEIATVITDSAQEELREVTILPEKRLDEIRADLINAGFPPEDVDVGLDASLYADHPALADKPSDATLEGYLYPETFQINQATELTDVIEASLNEMATRLSPQVRQAIRDKGLTVHEGVILASIVEREVGYANPEDRPRVAQVFLSRLELDMKLESNATTFYGAIIRGDESQYDQQNAVTYKTPYNTYENEGLPPSPVSNVLQSSINAVANPADTDYLFFVSGDGCVPEVDEPCVNYFSRTLQDHQRLA